MAITRKVKPPCSIFMMNNAHFLVPLSPLKKILGFTVDDLFFHSNSPSVAKFSLEFSEAILPAVALLDMLE